MAGKQPFLQFDAPLLKQMANRGGQPVVEFQQTKPGVYNTPSSISAYDMTRPRLKRALTGSGREVTFQEPFNEESLKRKSAIISEANKTALPSLTIKLYLRYFMDGLQRDNYQNFLVFSNSDINGCGDNIYHDLKKTHVLVPIPLLNFKLQAFEPQFKDFDEWVDEDLDRDEEQTIENWYYEGVVKFHNGIHDSIEKAANTMNNINVESLQNLVITKEGHTTVHNIWGNVKEGDNLFIMVKRVEDNEDGYMLSANSRSISYCNGGSHRPLRFLPYKCSSSRVPLKDTLYRDQFGRLKQAKIFHIGVVLKGSKKNYEVEGNGYANCDLFARSMYAIKQQHLIEIYTNSTTDNMQFL